MDFKNYIGHGGPGLIYLDILNTKPFQAKLRMVVLEGPNLNKERLIFEKKYTFGKAQANEMQ